MCQHAAYRDLTPPQYQFDFIAHEEGKETKMVDGEVHPALLG